jgi:arylsulfatase A-like enzyme
MKLHLSCLVLAVTILGCTEPKTRPNIIYIMVDDMGYNDLSIYGQQDYRTPVLDSLAREGMRFFQAYAAAPVCTPTRVAFMTGRYPQRNPVGLREPLIMDSTDMDLGLSPEIPTVSSILKKNGYKTALFGKWHLGFKPEFFPSAHGFDTFFGITPGGADYVSHRYDGKDVLFENSTPVKEEGYLTDLITAHAVDYISKTTGPFFISLQYTSPHWPWQKPGDPAYADSTSMSSGGDRETYIKMVQNLDENIGRVLAALEKAGLKDNTMIIFTSDNGGERYSSMTPLRGSKLDLYEGGIRVPAFVRWPGKIKPGSVTDHLAITMDWTVTILDAAQADVDGMQFDGMSLLPLLKGTGDKLERNLYWRITNRERWEAYRSGDWKYLKTNGHESLYNLSIDVSENTDLKNSEPQIFERLRAEFQNMDKEMLPPYVFPRKK